jgi:hypothetical protein
LTVRNAASNWLGYAVNAVVAFSQLDLSDST